MADIFDAEAFPGRRGLVGADWAWKHRVRFALLMDNPTLLDTEEGRATLSAMSPEELDKAWQLVRDRIVPITDVFYPGTRVYGVDQFGRSRHLRDRQRCRIRCYREQRAERLPLLGVWPRRAHRQLVVPQGAGRAGAQEMGTDSTCSSPGPRTPKLRPAKPSTSPTGPRTSSLLRSSQRLNSTPTGPTCPLRTPTSPTPS